MRERKRENNRRLAVSNKIKGPVDWWTYWLIRGLNQWENGFHEGYPAAIPAAQTGTNGVPPNQVRKRNFQENHSATGGQNQTVLAENKKYEWNRRLNTKYSLANE